MAENKTVKVTTTFVTTGKRPVIVVRSGNRKTQYPAPVSSTKTHAEAARKFVTKHFGKGSVLADVEYGPMGDKFTVTVPESTESE